MKTETFPTLYKTTSTGATQVWTIEVRNSGTPTIVRTFGRLDGKMQVNKEQVTAGKNIGRANETTPWDQAVSEARSKWNNQKDKGYSETKGKKGNVRTLPMLAKNLRDKDGNIDVRRLQFPLLVQPKLNGVRCMSDEELSWSRKAKPYPLVAEEMGDEISGVLKRLIKGAELDGEIYLPDVEFEEIASAVKKRGALTSKLQYHVFDVKLPDVDAPFTERYSELKHAVRNCKRIVLVPVYEIHSLEELKELHDKFVAMGYEGIIVRVPSGKYKATHRSSDLLKYKDFIDEEFKIVSGHEGKGNDKGTCIFTCKAKNGKEFDVRPKGTLERRKQYLTDLKKLIGKKLTVRYQNLSSYGVPIFPVGLVIRDYE